MRLRVIMAEPTDHLAQILARKRVEAQRRARFAAVYAELAERAPLPVSPLAALRRRAAEPPRVVAEIKLRSPSAGQIRPRAPGAVPRIAAAYQQAGAAAISVLCDGPGFGGTPLDLARAAARVRVPLLFKEFVLHPVQIDLARAAGASLVLLLACALDDASLRGLIDAARGRGLEPVVEAADAQELSRALATSATIVGINARDLRSFSVDPTRAAALVDRIPADRIAVFMSGIRSAQDFVRVSDGRADAALIGEGLMRAPDPGAALAALLACKLPS
jgi:indole-3-glycerol phosphate synthase